MSNKLIIVIYAIELLILLTFIEYQIEAYNERCHKEALRKEWNEGRTKSNTSKLIVQDSLIYIKKDKAP